MEQKVHSIKQRQITDEAKLEQNLKSDLESKKLTLGQIQEQLSKVRKLIAEENERREERNHGMYRHNDTNLKKEIGEIKDIVSNLALAQPASADQEFGA